MRPPNLGLQEKCPRDPLGAAIQVSPPTLCSTSRNALFAGPLLDGHEANPGRGSSRRSDKSRPGVGAVLRNKVRHPEGHGARMIPFTNWLWDELGKKAGYLNRNSGKELTLAIPAFGQEALDYLLRIASFWADEVHVKKKGGAISGNLWRKPVVNVFDDNTLDGAERSLVGQVDDNYPRFVIR